MTFYMFYPDSNNTKEIDKIRKYQKELEQSKKGKMIELRPKDDAPIPKTYRKVGDNYYEIHKTETGGTMIDLDKPITNLKDKEPTVKEFKETFGL